MSTITLEEKLLEKGKIFLFGDIKKKTALQCCQQLKYLISKKKKIFVFINSDGGDINYSNAIIDEIQAGIANKVSINTVAYGNASSAAAMILAYGKIRYATQNSVIMLHPIAYQTNYDYHKYQIKYANFAGQISENMMHNLAKRCGYISYKDYKKFEVMVDSSIWMTPNEAIQYKIIDKIWTYNEEKYFK